MSGRGDSVWRYRLTSENRPVVVQGRSWLLVHFGENSGLAGVELPDPESLASIVQNAAHLPVPTVRPGMTAGLDLRITGPGKDRDAYLNDVRKTGARLKRAGYPWTKSPRWCSRSPPQTATK